MSGRFPSAEGATNVLHWTIHAANLSLPVAQSTEIVASPAIELVAGGVRTRRYRTGSNRIENMATRHGTRHATVRD